MKFHQPTTILRVFDEAKAKEFYVDYLGFDIDWEHRFADTLPLQARISKGECIVHLSEHHGEGTPGTGICIACDDVTAYRRG